MTEKLTMTNINMVNMTKNIINITTMMNIKNLSPKYFRCEDLKYPKVFIMINQVNQKQDV